jgi:TPP-dependent pyruvate/acetoin dehydrogenase alpha subunit
LLSQPAVPEYNQNSTSPRAPLPQNELNQLYSTMLKARLLGQRFRAATRTGEAILAGTLQNAEDRDVIVSATGHPVLESLRGAELATLLQKGNGTRSLAEKKIVVTGPQLFASLAAGLASASKIANSEAVVIAFAPGSAAHGVAFEHAAAFAGVNRLPMVIVADWSDARRSARSHDGRDLSRWPFPTIAVDGRDAIAVYRVTKEAISAARRGHGPTLVDCVNFLAPGGRGRDDRDPLLSFRAYLKRHQAWSEEWHAELLARYKQEISGRSVAKR